MTASESPAVASPPGPWRRLSDGLDFSKYVPRPVPPEATYRQESERRGSQLILKSRTDRYLQLGSRDEFLWRNMDGGRSVADLVLLYFHEFSSFAFDRISVLVSRLREAGFLEDSPVEAFGSLRSRLESGRPEAIAARLAGMFVEHRIELSGLDRLITFFYRAFFWIFFTKPAALLFAMVCSAGTVAFVQVLAEGRYVKAFFTAQDSVAYGALALIAATALLVFIHQAAHVFAAKSRGREVPSAGFIISYGLPFFYAETTDIWLESRGARMMVSMAGTISDVLTGAAGALFIVAYPDSPWNPLVFKLSVVSYAALFMDLNPLFELDGYFALADWLEIPDLRARSLSFIRRRLWPKLRAKEPFDRDERIYATYGVLAVGWMVVVVLAALGFVGMQARVAISDIFSGESWVSAVAAAAVLLFFVIPVTLAVFAFLALGVWKAARWILMRAAFRDTRRLLALVLLTAVGAGAAAFAAPWLVRGIARLPGASAPLGAIGRILPTDLFMPVWAIVYPALVPGIVAASAALALRAAREVDGSRLARSMRLLAVFLGVEVARSAWESYAWLVGLESRTAHAVLDLSHRGLQAVAWVALVVWAVYVLVRVEWPLVAAWRRAVSGFSAVAVMGAFVWLATGLDLAPAESAQLLLALAACTLPVVALVSILVNYTKTLLWWAWMMLMIGISAGSLVSLGRLAGRGVLAGLQVNLVGAIFNMFGLMAFLIILRRMSVKVHRPKRADAAQAGDRARLTGAFGFIVASLAENMSQALGRGSVASLQGAFNWHARREHRSIRLDIPRVGLIDLVEGASVTWSGSDAGLEGAGILALADESRWALARIEREASALAGSRFFRRLVTAVYDELYWAEREPVYEHILRDFPWAGDIARLPRPKAAGVEGLIEATPLFEGLSAQQRGVLASRMRPRLARAGQRVVREGDPADAFYMIAEGELEVYREDSPKEPLATLRRGDYFGETAVARGIARTASVRAKSESHLLELGAADYLAFVRQHVSVAEKIEGIAELVGLLRRMPAFRELPLAQVALLAGAMRSVRAPAGEPVVLQGEPGTALYVIRRGEVEVLVERAGASARIATLGPGEYFGEIALLERVPRTATVKALTDCELLTLEKEAFDSRVVRSHATMQAMGRLSSRRRREIAERYAEASPSGTALAPSRQ